MAHTVDAMVLTGSSGLVTINGGDQDSAAFSNAVFVIDITTLTGTAPTATFTIQGKDPISGKYYNLLTSAVLAATGTTVLRVTPYITGAANVTAQDFIPPIWRINCTQGGTAVTNLTCTVGVHLLDG
jgi:hypothetical protein